MSNSKHTPGPWRHYKCLFSEDGFGVRDEGGMIALTSGSYPDLAESNVSRIVSCVNAMEGIEKPAQLRECFDEMLEAVRSIQSNNPDLTSGHEWFAKLDRLNAVIKKAEGIKS